MAIAAHKLVALPPGWVWRSGIDGAWEAHTLTGDVVVQEATDRSLTDTDGCLRICVNKWRPASGSIDAEGHALIESYVLVAVARANDHVVGVQ
jgi:hypothetical protein